MMLNSVPEKEIVAVILYTSCFFMIVAVVLIAFFYFSRKKIIQKEIEKKDLEIKYQNEQLKAIIVTQEAERKRIAQDLHDDISSKLNVVGLNCHLLRTPNLQPHEQEMLTNTIIELTNKALDNSRKIAHNLLPPVLEKFGLDAGVKELCMEFESTKAVNVTYKNTVEFDASDIDRHLHVFRILQELLNNSVRHGKATEVTITFSKKDSIFSCNYSDNGVGFDNSLAFNQKGLGTKNIESRVLFLDGKLTTKSSIGQGIVVLFTF